MIFGILSQATQKEDKIERLLVAQVRINIIGKLPIILRASPVFVENAK
jgi:hypothetical protein